MIKFFSPLLWGMCEIKKSFKVCLIFMQDLSIPDLFPTISI